MYFTRSDSSFWNYTGIEYGTQEENISQFLNIVKGDTVHYKRQ